MNEGEITMSKKIYMFFVLVLFEIAKIAYYSTICKYLKPYNLYINEIFA